MASKWLISEVVSGAAESLSERGSRPNESHPWNRLHIRSAPRGRERHCFLADPHVLTAQSPLTDLAGSEKEPFKHGLTVCTKRCSVFRAHNKPWGAFFCEHATAGLGLRLPGRNAASSHITSGHQIASCKKPGAPRDVLALLATLFKTSPSKHSSGEIEPTLLGTSTRIDKKEHRLKAPTSNLWDFSRLIESNRYSQKSRKTCYSKDGHYFPSLLKKRLLKLFIHFL